MYVCVSEQSSNTPQLSTSLGRGDPALHLSHVASLRTSLNNTSDASPTGEEDVRVSFVTPDCSSEVTRAPTPPLHSTALTELVDEMANSFCSREQGGVTFSKNKNNGSVSGSANLHSSSQQYLLARTAASSVRSVVDMSILHKLELDIMHCAMLIQSRVLTRHKKLRKLRSGKEGRSETAPRLSLKDSQILEQHSAHRNSRTGSMCAAAAFVPPS